MKKFNQLGKMLSKSDQKPIKGGLEEGGGCVDPGSNSYTCTITLTDCSTFTETQTADNCGCAKLNWYKHHSNTNVWSVNCCGNPTPCS
jgi:hypothetical protein